MVESTQGAVMTQSTTPASVPERPADLVLEGGGVKGIGLAGAAIALHDAGYRFQRVAGTSAGAIAAALIAALDAKGEPLTSLKDILATIEYPKFMEKGHLRAALGHVGDAEHLLLHMGMYDGDYLVEWLGDALRQIGITKFGDLAIVDPGADSGWDKTQLYSLVVHTADITRHRIVRLPWDFPVYGSPDTDNELIVDAVRASMSIPFFFEPVRKRVPDATIDGVKYDGGTVTWVDGGLLSNFPVEVFDRTDGAAARWPTVGIKLSAKSAEIHNAAPVKNVVNEAVACVQTMIDNDDRYYLPSSKSDRTIFVDNAGVGSTDFHLTAAQQQQLFANGTAAATAWVTSNAVPA
jgi:NTE family protein